MNPPPSTDKPSNRNNIVSVRGDLSTVHPWILPYLAHIFDAGMIEQTFCLGEWGSPYRRLLSQHLFARGRAHDAGPYFDME